MMGTTLTKLLKVSLAIELGPHDVLVNHDQAPRAREVLAETMIEDEDAERAELEGEIGGAVGGGGATSPARLALWVVGLTALAFLVIWVLYEIS